jgi:transcription antitermination factor NusG
VPLTKLTSSGHLGPSLERVRWPSRVDKCGDGREVYLALRRIVRYLFCRFTPFVTGRVIGTLGVVRLMGFRNGDGTIDDEEIQAIRKLIAAGARPFKGPVVGDRFRIKSGVMQGLTGIVLSRDDEQRLVFTLSDLELRVAVRIDLENIEPI